VSRNASKAWRKILIFDSSSSATALSDAPPENNFAESIMADITPRTANRIAQLADAREKAAVANEARKTAPKKKVRIAAFDDEIELDEDEVRGAGRRDISSILGKVSSQSHVNDELF
jgi:hypothetical protein